MRIRESDIVHAEQFLEEAQGGYGQPPAAVKDKQ
jgi:hypothetical protein